MSPYLTILKDSFREAFASRVLWIVLGLATLVLVILAGFGLEEHAGASFTRDDIGDALGLHNKIVQQAGAAYPTPGKRIWALVDDESKAELAETVAAAESTAFRQSAGHADVGDAESAAFAARTVRCDGVADCAAGCGGAGAGGGGAERFDGRGSGAAQPVIDRGGISV